MATVRNRSGHPLSLTGGRDFAHNEVVNVDLSNSMEAKYLEEGLITIVDANTDPPPPAEPLRNRPRMLFMSRTQPDNMPVGSVWFELDVDDNHIATWEMR